MTDGPLSFADRERVAEGVGHEVFGVVNGVENALLAGEVGRDRGGERAARTVGVGCCDRFRFQGLEGFAIVENVNASQVLCHTASFHENDFRAEAMDALGGGAHVVQRVDFQAREQLGFVVIWGQDRCFGKQEIAQDRNGTLGEQLRARPGNHHRIDDEGRDPPLSRSLGNRSNDFFVRQHAGLCRTNTNIFSNGIDLGGNEIGGEAFNAIDAEGILSGNAGNSTRTVNAVEGKRTEVGLDARAPTAVRTGDREGNRNGRHKNIVMNRTIAWDADVAKSRGCPNRRPPSGEVGFRGKAFGYAKEERAIAASRPVWIWIAATAAAYRSS